MVVKERHIEMIFHTFAAEREREGEKEQHWVTK